MRSSRGCASTAKTADSAKLTKVPANLDLTPYLDENDGELIKTMQRAMKA